MPSTRQPRALRGLAGKSRARSRYRAAAGASGPSSRSKLSSRSVCASSDPVPGLRRHGRERWAFRRRNKFRDRSRSRRAGSGSGTTWRKPHITQSMMSWPFARAMRGPSCDCHAIMVSAAAMLIYRPSLVNRSLSQRSLKTVKDGRIALTRAAFHRRSFQQPRPRPVARAGLRGCRGRCGLRRGQIPALQDRPHVRAGNSGAKRQASRARANGNCRSRIWRRWPNAVRQREIQFSCTPFYLEAVEELRPFVDFYKVASYELLVTPLLEACARTGKPVVLSTGMATMDEIMAAAATLQQRRRARHHAAALRLGLSDAAGEANLAAIAAIREATGCTIGWSDHTRRRP